MPPCTRRLVDARDHQKVQPPSRGLHSLACSWRAIAMSVVARLLDDQMDAWVGKAGQAEDIPRKFEWEEVWLVLRFCGKCWCALALVYATLHVLWRACLSRLGSCVRVVETLEVIMMSPFYAAYNVLVLGALALLQCAMFIKISYTFSAVAPEIGTLDTAAVCLYSVDLLLRLASGESKSPHLVGFDLMIDALIVPSAALRASSEGRVLFAFDFLASIRFVRSYLQIHFAMQEWLGQNSVALKITSMVVYSVLGMFFTASVFFLLEQLGEMPGMGAWMSYVDGDEEITFFTSIYFCFVTFSTVGYGDILPSTVLSRIVTITFIIVGIYMFTAGVNDMVEVMKLNRLGKGSYVQSKAFQHVVVTGTPNFDMMKDFLFEFFSATHGNTEQYKVVFLLKPHPENPSQPSVEMQRLASWLKVTNDIHIKKQSVVLQGSTLEKGDLLRAAASEAHCAFVLPDLQSSNPMREDSDNVLRALSLKRFCPELRLLCLLRRSDHQSFLLSSGVSQAEVVVMDATKMEILGKNCAVPGFLPLLANMCRSETSPRDDEVSLQWSSQYQRGASKDVFFMPLSPAYYGMTFASVVQDIFTRSSSDVALIAVVYESGSLQRRRMQVNPGPEWKLPTTKSLMGVFIAQESDLVHQQQPTPHEVLRNSSECPFTPRRRRKNSSWHNVFAQLMESTGTEGAPLRENSGPSSPGSRGKTEGSEKTPSRHGPVNQMRADQGLVSMSPALLSVFENLETNDDRDPSLLTSNAIMRRVQRLRVKYMSNEQQYLPEQAMAAGGHVLLCWPGHAQGLGTVRLLDFVKPLRAPHIAQPRPVVVLAPQRPEDWERVRHCDCVYFVQGDALSLPVLEEVNFRKAHAVVLLRPQNHSENSPGDNRYSADSDVIFATRQIEGQLANSPLRYAISDIAIDANGEYLTVGALSKFDALVSPEVMDGLKIGVPPTTTEVDGMMESIPTEVAKRAGANGALCHGTSGSAFGPMLPDNGDSPWSANFAGFAEKAWANRSVSGLLSGRDMRLARHPLTERDPAKWATLPVQSVVKSCNLGLFRRAENETIWSAPCHSRYLTSRFASGQLFVSSIFTMLMVNTFRKPELILLVRQLVSSEMLLLKPPENLVQQTYAEAFSHFLTEEGVILIGLFRNRSRQAQPGQSSFAGFFTVTAPPGKTVLREDDYAFGIVPAYRRME